MEFLTFRIKVPTKNISPTLNQQLYQWKAEQKPFIRNAFIVLISIRYESQKEKYLVLETTSTAIDYLPKEIIYENIPALEPVWGIVADIPEQTLTFNKHEKYIPVSGTKHFSAGQKVYPFPKDALPFDYNEMILVAGKHKENGKYITIMQPMRRLINWRVELITNPIIIFLMRYQNGWGSTEQYNREVAEKLAEEMQILFQNKGFPWPAGFLKDDKL